MTARHIAPARRIQGEVALPGDKSIAHRAALIGSIATGTTTASNFPSGADCRSTLGCLRQLGVRIREEGGTVEVEGRGLGGLAAPGEEVDAGNSGTTVRLLAGILAAHPFTATLVGDASLSRRPMMRVVEPLALFGAGFETREGRLPLRIRGGHLAAIRYALPVPSAQVKSAILLAGAHATGTTVVEEPVPLRDHTEIALREAGARLRCGGGRVEIDGGVPLGARSIRIPADMSSASFFIAAALGLPDSEIVLPALGCNSGRRGFVDLLIRAGADIAFSSERDESGEPVGDARACSSRIGCLEIDAAMVPALVDEIPVLAVLAAASGQGLEVRGAGELRHKETDRIHALVSNLTAVGVRVEELEDGLRLESSGIRGGVVSSFGDHRIAMAFAIGGLMSREGITIESPECVDISFPGFFPALEGVVER